MNSEDTIAAIATPLGTGGVGIIRLSGPQALFVASRMFRGRKAIERASSHTICPGQIVENGKVLDQALASVFLNPRSYTGEDVVELSCHGSPVLLKQVLALCLSHGARLAEPGEFTRRAYLNGKMDLAQAEAVAELISAQSDRLRRVALEQLQGYLSSFIRELRTKTINLLAHVEANLDFAEEEVPDLKKSELKNEIDGLHHETRRLLATAPYGRLLRDGLRVALAGKPNVGKSSLFNALLGTDRAIVTEIPGTTRDTLEERLLIDDIPVVLTDTAGLRDGGDVVENEGIARTRRAADTADVLLFVVDASTPVSSGDQSAARLWRSTPDTAVDMAARLWRGSPDTAVDVAARLWRGSPDTAVDMAARLWRGSPDTEVDVAARLGRENGSNGHAVQSDRKIIVALNKCDRLSSSPDTSAVLSMLRPHFGMEPSVALNVSAKTGEGLEKLREAVAASATSANRNSSQAESGPVPTLVSMRHVDLLRRACDALSGAAREASERASEECLAIDLRRALDCFNQITGEGVHDEVLNAVFSRFCIGK